MIRMGEIHFLVMSGMVDVLSGIMVICSEIRNGFTKQKNRSVQRIHTDQHAYPARCYCARCRAP